MKFAILASIVAASAGIVSAASGAPYCPPREATVAEQQVIFDEFIEKLYIQHNVSQALMDHGDVNWIEHDPAATSGRAVVIAGLGGFLPMTKQTFIHKGLIKDLGFTHFREDVTGSDAPPNAIVDFFRFNGTCIMEHWDVSQPKEPNATNPLAMWS